MSCMRPAVAITRTRPSSRSMIAVRSNGTRPRNSRMNAPNASSSSSDEPSACAQRFAPSSTWLRRSSWSRSCSASSARSWATAVSVREPLDEPADDEGNHHFDDDLHRDVLPAEPLVEVVVAEPLEPEQHRDARCGDHQPAANPVAEGRLDQDEDHDLPDRGGLLVVEPEDEGRDNDEVEDQGGEAEPSERVPIELTPGQEQQHDCSRGEHGGRRPEPHSLADRVRICGDRLEGDERHGPEPDPGEPALGVRPLLVAHAEGSRSPIRANAHSACSRSRSSSPLANGSASAASAAPPTLPSATSAFRRR